MARDKDDQALEAFVRAFGQVVPVRKKDAKIRLGKVAIALEQVDKALMWAQTAGFTPEQVHEMQQMYDELKRTAELESQKQNPDMRALDELKTVCRDMADSIRKTRRKQKISDIPPNGGIYVNDIPGLDDLGVDEREEKVQQVRQQVCRGSNLTSAILQDDPNFTGLAPTVDSVVDMCWYFKGMAQEKLGTPYQQGALTLPDPDGRLAKFIDSCPEIYPRDSSHLRPQQQGEGSQGRGIDAGGRFPGGMNTVLFHPFVTEKGERRLYVKFETAGAYGHLRTDKREVARRPKNETDDEMSNAHAQAFLSGGKEKDLAETREGTVDLPVQAAYQAIYDAAEDYRRILDRGRQKSKQNSQGDITAFSRVLSFTPLAPNYWDVQTQKKNFDDLIVALAEAPERRQALHGVLVAWCDAMDDAGYRTDARSRLGDEVVLGLGDLGQVQSHVDVHEGDIDRDQSMIKPLQLLRDRMDQQKVLLQGKLENIPYVYYKKLAVPDDGQQLHEFTDVLTIDTQAEQFRPYVADNAKVATGRINKGTNLLKNKWFEYTGDVTQIEMFAALRNTGWNLGNLNRAVDLKKKD